MITIDIAIKDQSWLKEIDNIEHFLEKTINNLAQYTSLNKLIKNKTEIELSILLTNDQEIKSLNKNYRNKNKATNTLSFPLISRDEKITENIFDNFIAIGDIIFSLETIKKEADSQNKKFQHHFTHLLLHSLLHLIGYDHQNDQEAQKMEDLEINILKKLAINNPYNIIK